MLLRRDLAALPSGEGWQGTSEEAAVGTGAGQRGKEAQW